MKIKCPLCNEFECLLEDSLIEHFYDKHGTEEIWDYFTKMYFKIHEKIESLETRIIEIKQNKYYSHKQEVIRTLDVVILELKSLLEELEKK